MKLTEIIEALGWYPDQVNGVKEEYKQMVKQLKDDYEKARKCEELERKLAIEKENKRDLISEYNFKLGQNQKLRELIEKEVYPDCDCEYGGCRHSMAEEVLEESKK